MVTNPIDRNRSPAISTNDDTMLAYSSLDMFSICSAHVLSSHTVSSPITSGYCRSSSASPSSYRVSSSSIALLSSLSVIDSKSLGWGRCRGVSYSIWGWLVGHYISLAYA